MNNVQQNTSSQEDVVILGAGLAGLSTGYVLAQNSRRVCLLESTATVGGLSKTVAHGGFLFDLGGHRFLTKNKKIEKLVLDLLADESLRVSRTSKIYMLDRYFDYPLKPANAIFGLGLATTCQILFDYCKEKLVNIFRTPKMVSLEDWIVSQFGRKMFDIYFKGYSEKVWGIECENISKEWIAQRINGLSLGAAIKNAFCKFSGRKIMTLTDEFYYPRTGIGRISDRLKEEIEKKNHIKTETRVVRINHENYQVTDIVAQNGKSFDTITGNAFVSSIPLTSLVQSMQPPPPTDVLAAAAELKYRDIVIATIMLDTERVTDLTWLYLPGDDIPFGRIHEPKNWSPEMAPVGKTHLVVEYFCFKDDAVWNASDEELTAMTVQHLEKLDFIKRNEVLDSCIIREQKAYPLFAVGYQEHYEKLIDYLSNFKNLHIAGRGGMFKYYNMDHAMESGIEVAEEILAGQC
jgi:protoporphyrinogen oxidase